MSFRLLRLGTPRPAGPDSSVNCACMSRASWANWPSNLSAEGCDNIAESIQQILSAQLSSPAIDLAVNFAGKGGPDLPIRALHYKMAFPTQSSVAQSVEQAAVNRWVVGSSPTRGAFLSFAYYRDRPVNARRRDSGRRAFCVYRLSCKGLRRFWPRTKNLRFERVQAGPGRNPYGSLLEALTIEYFAASLPYNSPTKVISVESDNDCALSRISSRKACVSRPKGF